MRKLRSICGLVCLCASLCGCLSIPIVTSNETWVYERRSRVANLEQPMAAHVAVLPLVDSRGTYSINAFWLGLLPPLPYGGAAYDRPELASHFIHHRGYEACPVEDFSKAIVAELEVNALFEGVFFTHLAGETAVDWQLTGELRRYSYHGRLVNYCVSFLGSAFWIFGLPVGWVENEIDLTLELKHTREDRVLWRHHIQGRSGRSIGFYNSFGAEFDGYPQILRRGLQAGIRELDAHLMKHGMNGSIESRYAPDADESPERSTGAQ
jgi:hypothetical protein